MNWRPKEFWAGSRTISSAPSVITWARRSSSGPFPATSLRPSYQREKSIWPMGHHFGVPFHLDLHRRVLFEASKLLETATESGAIRDILIGWAEVRCEVKTLTDQGRNL